MTTFGNDEIEEVTFHGDQIEEITLHGDTVWQAVTTTVVDDFEGTDPLSNYIGSTGTFSIESTPTYAGNGALHAASGWASDIASISGLDNYPAKGDEFEVYWRMDIVDSSYAVAGFDFGAADRDNHYQAWLNWNTGSLELRLRIVQGGSASTLRSGTLSFTPQPNTWYRCHVQWDDGNTFGGSDGDLTLTMEDAISTDSTTVTANDTTFDSGGIGFYTDQNHGVYWDEFIIL